MTDTELLARFERRSARGCFFLRERATGKRTRQYITLRACSIAAERGELYSDDEYTELTRIPTGAGGRKTHR